MRKMLPLMVFALVLLVGAFPALAQSITGPVRVVDGDTLAMKGERIRIHGINAPESKQACDQDRWSCGQAATQAMVSLVAGRPVSCSGRERDHYGRLVAVCVNHRGQDMGRELVRAGLATAYRRYSMDYVAEELAAKSEGRGVWAGEFEDPERYRHQGGMAGEGALGNVAVEALASQVLGPRSLSSHALSSGGVHETPTTTVVKNGVRSMAGWLGRTLDSVVRSGHSSPGVASHGAGNYSALQPSESMRAPDSPSALAPPSQGMAPPGVEGVGRLSADQVCAVSALLDRPCR